MERKIGEIFQDGDVRLKVVNPAEYNGCDGCYYDYVPCVEKRHLRGFCCAVDRQDEKEVIFIKQD